MAEQIKTHRVHKNIKTLDKAAAAAEHRKRACVREKENTGQEKEDKTLAEYAENFSSEGRKKASGRKSKE